MAEDLTSKDKVQSANDELTETIKTVLAENMGGLTFFSNGFKRGYGNNLFGSDDNGIWLGAADFSNGLVRFYMDGSFYLGGSGTIGGDVTIESGVTIAGYIQVGKAADDVNASATTISGVKITNNTIAGEKIIANAITADKISVTSLAAISANLGTITAGSISANLITGGTINGSVVNVTNLNADNISAGQLVANRIVDLSASKITSGTFGTDRIPNLSVDKLTSGTLYVGYSGRPGAIYIAHGSDGDAKFYFEGNSRMWSDSSNRIGINSLGSPMYIYVGSNQRLAIPSSGQTNISGGVYCDGNLNVTGDMRCNKITFNQSSDENNLDAVNIIKGYNDLNFQIGNNGYYFSWYNADYSEKMYLKSNGDWHVTGSKSSDIEIKRGVVSVYAPESPEVYLFDFCKDKKELDSEFLEMTEGKSHFLKCEDGEFLVFRHRKGYADRRLELVDTADHDAKAALKKKLFGKNLKSKLQ